MQLHSDCAQYCWSIFLIIRYFLIWWFFPPPSLVAAGLMHTFNAHAATDITGFGILGHAQNLAKQQRNEVSFVIHNLPVLAKMAAVSKACGNMFGLMHGTCPETSGRWQLCHPLLSLHLHLRVPFQTYKSRAVRLESQLVWHLARLMSSSHTAAHHWLLQPDFQTTILSWMPSAL